MRVLMIGGVNFVGLAVTRSLLADGHSVAVYHRGRSEPNEAHDAVHIHGERDDLLGARDLFVHFRPDVAIHMIAMTQAHGEAFTAALGGVARRAVVISSMDVYRAYGRLIGTEPGDPDPTPLTEDAPLRQRLFPYRGDKPRAADDPARWLDDYDKILVERAVMSNSALPCAVIRLPAVYGPRDGQRRFRPWLKRMDDGRPAILMDAADARWRWTHGYVEDMAHAVTLAALDPRSVGRTYNAGEQTALTQAERVQSVADAAGWRGRLVVAPSGMLPERFRLGGDARQDLVADSARIRAELDYTEVTPLATSYARTITWERENPPERDEPAQYDYDDEDHLLDSLG